MDPLAELSDGRIISLSDGIWDAEAIMMLHRSPFRACPCCEGTGVHEVGLFLGPIAITREFKCRACEDGLIFYITTS